jgi:hypothetical protein
MSYHRRYKLKDDRFGLMALTLREKAGLAQTAATVGLLRERVASGSMTADALLH